MGPLPCVLYKSWTVELIFVVPPCAALVYIFFFNFLIFLFWYH